MGEWNDSEGPAIIHNSLSQSQPLATVYVAHRMVLSSYMPIIAGSDPRFIAGGRRWFLSPRGIDSKLASGHYPFQGEQPFDKKLRFLAGTDGTRREEGVMDAAGDVHGHRRDHCSIHTHSVVPLLAASYRQKEPQEYWRQLRPQRYLQSVSFSSTR